ncbi:alpha/beta fold hydrolase [Streptoalloteichus hindustanus]|uniref:Pimeloyl-ACP methyl ester carboxylesterase n=1 Tax=Streptoalloteichus hindustanus TaxID=2017 RepID=A0A1M5CYK3_STRHI|nr:alpha/beta hydrolase [Streptoalloteichus hindustanus]SHF59727.1 Pimeloyl-ACP methyl ester carboxylesterase [Streptoalloteichus hindustanus]
MVQATLHDGSPLELEVHGSGPTVLLPVNPHPATGSRADEMRKWGMDPELGRSLVRGLGDDFRVVAFDYEGHVLAHPKPDTLTPDNIAADLVAVADAAGADRFAYYGYSWLALSGLQLAVRTNRLSALAMGGFPALGGPYAEMLRVTIATHEMSGSASSEPQQAPQSGDEYDWSTVEVTMTKSQTRQFVTLYEALQEFDDRAAQPLISCPRLCFVGSADTIPYGERWGGVTVDIAGAVAGHRAELEAAGWDVRVLDGLDHTTAMQPGAVLPVLRLWLTAQLGR